MDEKRELTSVDLAALVGELGAYEGAKVDKAYLYPPDLVRIKLRDHDRGRAELLIEVGDPKRAGMVDPERVPDAPGRPPEFAKMLRNRIAGGEFAGVEQFGFDRILQFHFERPDGRTTVVAELFGDGNVAVLDGDRVVVDCLETVRLKSRSVVPGSPYEFPSTRVNPVELDYEAFAREMDDSDTDVVRTLATQLNFGGLWAEELCTRAGVEKALDIADAGEAEYEAVYDAIRRLVEDLRGGNLDPRIYFEPGEEESPEDGSPDDGDDGAADAVKGDGAPDAGDGGSADAGDGGSADAGDADAGSGGPPGRPVDVTPVPLAEREGLPAEAYGRFTDALDDYFHLLESVEEEVETGRDRPDFESEIAKRERIVEQQEAAIEDFERQAEAERERAELCYAHYGLVDEVLSTVRAAREDGVPWADIEERFEEGKDRGIDAAEAVAGIDEREGTVTLELEGTRVELDPREGVEQNADRLYGEAKRIEEKREGALEAIENTREELAEVEARRDAWEADDGEDEEEEGDDEFADRDWLTEPSIPVRREEAWYERFRWFRTSDGFLVLGGRNADQNEELVKKYMESGDLFFHTQAHGAPVTLLKAADPSESARDVTIPEKSREEAATFAVSYSSVWKDGQFAGDVYMARPDQVTKTPESGEFLQKGGFTVRGERTYYEDTPVGVTVGITCRPETRVIGGPPDPIEERAVTTVSVEPGRYAQADAAKRIYRVFRERFSDTAFVRKVASPDRIQHFLPPGGSRMVDADGGD